MTPAFVRVRPKGCWATSQRKNSRLHLHDEVTASCHTSWWWSEAVRIDHTGYTVLRAETVCAAASCRPMSRGPPSAAIGAGERVVTRHSDRETDEPKDKGGKQK